MPRKASAKARSKSSTPKAPQESADFQKVLEAFAASSSTAPIVRAYQNDRARSGARKFGANALKVGGKIFAMSVQGRLVVKLPAPRVTELSAAGAGSTFELRGRRMKEWFSLKPGDRRALELAREAHEFGRGGAKAKTR